MADKPSVLFVSCSDVTPDEIIQLIRSGGEPSDSIAIDDNIIAYPYHIDNKYYSTDINLCSLKTKVIANKKFASTVEGAVIYFDKPSSEGLKDVEVWLPFLKEYRMEIKMLLCKNCPEESPDGSSRRVVQEWCIGKGFELTELEPDVDEEDLDDDFPETTGVSRVIQALNAHVWPNLVMKNSKMSDEKKNRVDSELSTLAGRLHLEQSFEELLENDDDFSELFSHLPELKAQVSALQGDERVTAAVQIVEAFWKTLEIEDNDDNILDL